MWFTKRWELLVLAFPLAPVRPVVSVQGCCHTRAATGGLDGSFMYKSSVLGLVVLKF